MVGSDGVFNAFGTDWTFKVYGEHGENHYFNMLENILATPYYNAAIDAVGVTAANQNDLALRAVPVGQTDFSPTALTALPTLPIGSVICRSPQARSVGCAPANLFGRGNLSQAAQQFIQGYGNGTQGGPAGRYGRYPWQAVAARQEVFDAGASGDIAETWAGKINAFVGFQYREEAYNVHTDCASRGNCAQRYLGRHELWSGRQSAADPGHPARRHFGAVGAHPELLRGQLPAGPG